ncbi:MAG: urea ABC transporter permease subunit UrtB [Verrucomicrobiota bacterium]
MRRRATSFAPPPRSPVGIRIGLFALAAATVISGGGAPVAPAWGADADPLRTAINGLASSAEERVTESVKQLAALDDPRAIGVLEALNDDRLRAGADGQAWIWDRKARELVDPLTGAVAPASARPAKEVEVNNDVRRFSIPALASLQLASPNADVRLAAADELAKGGSGEGAILLAKALGREKDPRVRGVLAMVVARLNLESPDAEVRLAAVKMIHQSGNDGYLGELERLTGTGADGNPNEPDARVRGEASEAVSAIVGRRRMISAVGSLLHGLSLSSVLLFVALGLAITFGLLGVINMAHGEMLTLGAYATYSVQVFFQSYAPGYFRYYLIAAVPVAFAVTFGIGVFLERVVIRHLYGRPLETLLATWGISLVLIQTIRLQFGAQNVAVANPDWMAGGFEIAHGLVLPYSRIGVIGFVIVVALGVWVLLYRTRIGLNVRAMTQNRGMAACVGIPTKRLDAWMFGLGSGIAGLGGVALSQLGNVGPEMGQGYIIDSFMVVVLGGVGRLAGSVVAALGLGVLNKLIEPAAGAVFGKILVLGIVILFIQRRPQGLFALKGRTEA